MGKMNGLMENLKKAQAMVQEKSGKVQAELAACVPLCCSLASSSHPQGCLFLTSQCRLLVSAGAWLRQDHLILVPGLGRTSGHSLPNVDGSRCPAARP